MYITSARCRRQELVPAASSGRPVRLNTLAVRVHPRGGRCLAGFFVSWGPLPRLTPATWYGPFSLILDS